jgi:hypothetical protein
MDERDMKKAGQNGKGKEKEFFFGFLFFLESESP